MSEHAPRSHEAHKPHVEKNEIPKNHEVKTNKSETETAISPEKAKENLESLRHEVAEKAISKEDVVIGSSEKESANTSQPLIDKELKGVMLTRTIARVQKHLKPAERTFSKVIHNKPVDKISSVGEKTVARPYGILGGALLAFLGSVFSTFISKQFGLNYNLFLFVLLFGAGYIIATLLEGVVRLIQKTK